jgi:eukaryotic-like serine/threonine-protein kinase
MSAPLHDHNFYRFDEFELSRLRRTLLRKGSTVPLLPKTFEVLCCLVSQSGRVLTKEEILRAVWPGSYVEENNLTQHISLLRKALADRAGYIVTIPGRGYQFTAIVITDRQPADGASSPTDRRIAPEADLGPIEAGQSPPADQLPAQPAPDPLPSPAVAPLAAILRSPRRPTIPRWAKGSLAATLAAAIGAAGFWLWSRSRTPPQSRTVLVADWSNATGDTTFDRTLKRALEIDLEQSGSIDVMSEGEARNMLALMGRSQDSILTPDLGREICERSNRQVLVTGAILPVGGEYLLTLEAVDCATGRKLASAKAEAAAKERVLTALDTVANRVRRGLGESGRSIENGQVPIMQATTASLDALRYYSIGQSMDAEGSSEIEILPFYQRAIELDPQFAMAYGAMANEYYNLGEPNLAAQYYRKAFELSDRVSAREKLVLEAHYYSEGRADMEQGINTYRQWVEAYPNDWVPWVNLANDYIQIGQYRPAIAAGRQALKIQPDRAISYSVLVRALKGANQFADAKAVALDAVRRGRDSAGLHASLYEIAAAGGDNQALAGEIEWAAKHDSGWYKWYFTFLRGEAAASAGKRQQAEELFRSAWDIAQREKLEEAANDIILYQAWVEFCFGLPAASRATLGRAHNLDPHSPDLAVLNTALGDPTVAKHLLKENDPDAPSGTLSIAVDLPRVRAMLAMAQGRPLDAIDALEPARPYEMTGYAVPTARAEAWLKAGHPELAVSEYGKILSNQGIDPLSPLYSMAHLGMARAYGRQNKITESQEEYERFFAEWKEADSDLPVLTQARLEYAKLGKSRGGALR